MSKNSKKIYLQFLLALVRRRFDILDPSKEDVVPAKQLLQLQPLLNLLSQDLENVGRGRGASSHIPRSMWCYNGHGLRLLKGTHLASADMPIYMHLDKEITILLIKKFNLNRASTKIYALEYRKGVWYSSFWLLSDKSVTFR